LERFAYLNAGTLGPLSRPTLAAIEERLRFDQEHGRGGHDWFMSVLELRTRGREQIADLVGTTPGQVALTSSTTDGCNIVLSGLELGPDDEVVTTNSEHPGLLLPLHVSGVRVRVAEVAALPTAAALETILSCITPRTRLLALSHVLWTTGQVMPVHELKRESGVPVLVDGAQSVGAIPVDVGELDYYTVSCQKWLCGPEPLGALYVRDADQLGIGIPSYFAQKSLEPGRELRTGRGRRAIRFRLAGLTQPRGPGGGARRCAGVALRARRPRWQRSVAAHCVSASSSSRRAARADSFRSFRQATPQRKLCGFTTPE